MIINIINPEAIMRPISMERVEKTRENILGRGYKEVFRTIPCWQDILNKFFHSYNKDMVLIAYEKE